MLSFALAAVLHFAGGTPSAVDHAARAYLSQVDAPPPPPMSIEPRRSLFELNEEIKALKNDQPGLGFPIAFIAIGGGVAIIDALLLVYQVVFFYGLTVASLVAFGVIMGIAILGFAATGFLVLGLRLGARAKADARIAELEAEYESRLQRGEHPYNLDRTPEAPMVPPPPPPPPPPSAGFVPMLEPALVLAQF